MAVEYFCAYHSYLDALEPLTDAERGRLFVACLKYSKSGEVGHLSGNERFVFPVFRGQIDRDNAKYANKCKKQSDNANKRWDKDDANDAMACDGMPNMPPHENYANDAKEKAKEKENEKEKAKEKAKEKEKNSSFSCSAAVDLEPPRDSRRPAPESDFSAYSFSPALQAKLVSWFAYKQERRQPYTPQQRQALLQTVAQKLSSYPESAIISLVDQCMVAGWKNIIFERLDKPGAVPHPTGPRPLDADEQAAIRRIREELELERGR